MMILMNPPDSRAHVFLAVCFYFGCCVFKHQVVECYQIIVVVLLSRQTGLSSKSTRDTKVQIQIVSNLGMKISP